MKVAALNSCTVVISGATRVIFKDLSTTLYYCVSTRMTEIPISAPENAARIQLGDYVIIQRQKYTKLQKFSSLDTTTMLGKEQLELKGILNHLYGSTFKMCRKAENDSVKISKKIASRLHVLELCNETELRNIREVLGISASGADNRDISDSGDSQTLRPEDIELLREECGAESTKIIEKIVENSKTFHAKTEYSQEKYLKKKEKKYFEYVQIRKPSIRLISEIFYRQDTEKIMGIRIDTLSQLLSYSGISNCGNYLLYESGTNGLLPAACLNAMGANTQARLVHLHPGNIPQKQAMLALNLPQEQLQRCISVNVYSVLREFYQHSSISIPSEQQQQITNTEEEEPTSKKPKLEGDVATSEIEPPTCDKIEKTYSTENSLPLNPATTEKWQQDNARACKIMETKFDALIVVAKEHPSNILNTLLPLVKPSRPIVVFGQCREVLMDLYVELKVSTHVTNLHLTSNWLRMYQILPNRTHPEVNMNGNKGYLLCGYTVR